MAARIEARRDQRGNCGGGPKSDFSRRTNVFFPMAGMDRSTLISRIKKKETILWMSFLVRLAFLNRDVSPAMGGGVPRRDCVLSIKSNRKSIENQQGIDRKSIEIEWWTQMSVSAIFLCPDKSGRSYFVDS